MFILLVRITSKSTMILLLLCEFGAMQVQRGTLGFHEQGESTRLKIDFYVTAI